MDMQKTIDTLKAEGFAVSYFETGREAVDYLCSRIHGRSVGFGGSQTVKDLGLIEALGADNTVVSHNLPGGNTREVRLAARAASELDIRGMETLEAEGVVANYIDAAVRSKLGTVTIIHGKGTGALRKAVHEMLKRNKAVKSFRLGRYGEGEAGVTVVELK